MDTKTILGIISIAAAVVLIIGVIVVRGKRIFE